MNWREQAACREADPETFFPVGETDSPGYRAQVRAAMAYCARCPVRRACLDDAVAGELTVGVFGGTMPEERRVAMRDSTHIAEGTVGTVRRALPDYASSLPGGRYGADRYGPDGYGRTPGRGVRTGGAS